MSAPGSSVDLSREDPSGVHPFRIETAPDVLADLRARLRRTRWPTPPQGSGWSAGTDVDFLQDLCRYWAEEFDWPAVEERLNAWPQVITVVDGQRLHAIHARSPEPDAIPLLLTHGWPGSVIEFLDVIGPLTDPRSHGLDPTVAFHVVCPSLPGYGWSGPTTELGWDVARAAAAEDSLMHRLGYDRYAAQGGDWGAFVTVRLALAARERLIGIHLNLVPAAPPDPDQVFADLDEVETARITRYLQGFQKSEMAYAAVQATKPDTVGVSLNDSPAGLAAWIVEKFRSWSDCDGDVLSVFTRDQLLANLTTYWVTGTAASAARLYWETSRSGGLGIMRGPGQPVQVPTACALLPQEIYLPPRAWVERDYDLRQWTEFPRGGHFAAFERPAEFVADVRTFFASITR